MEQKVIQVGNSLGVVIPANLRTQNGLQTGSSVVLKQTEEGILITSPRKQATHDVDAKFAKMVDEFITEHEDVLKELANR